MFDMDLNLKFSYLINLGWRREIDWRFEFEFREVKTFMPNLPVMEY